MRRHRPDFVILVLMAALMVVGLIVVYAIGPTWARFQNSVFDQDLSDWHFFMKHIVSVAVAVVAFAAAYLVPIKTTKRLSRVILGAGFALCIFMAIASLAGGLGVVDTVNGSASWIYVGAFSFQPAELLKIGLILYLAGYLSGAKRDGSLDNWKSLIPVAIVVGAALLFVAVIQNDIGTALTIGLIVLVMMVASGMSWKILGPILGGILVMGLVVAPIVVSHLPPEKQNRFPVWMGAEEQSEHIQNALLALGTGGVTGVGIGGSVQTAGYLPESLNDSIFAVIGEVFGFVGAAAVVVMLAMLCMRTVRTGERLVDDDSRLITMGVFAWIASHALINIMGISGLFIFTGITLPFLSTGGSSMMMMGAALGMVMQLSCYTSREVINDHENISSWRGNRRARDAGRSRS